MAHYDSEYEHYTRIYRAFKAYGLNRAIKAYICTTSDQKYILNNANFNKRRKHMDTSADNKKGFIVDVLADIIFDRTYIGSDGKEHKYRDFLKENARQETPGSFRIAKAEAQEQGKVLTTIDKEYKGDFEEKYLLGSEDGIYAYTTLADVYKALNLI